MIFFIPLIRNEDQILLVDGSSIMLQTDSQAVESYDIQQNVQTFSNSPIKQESEENLN